MTIDEAPVLRLAVDLTTIFGAPCDLDQLCAAVAHWRGRPLHCAEIPATLPLAVHAVTVPLADYDLILALAGPPLLRAAAIVHEVSQLLLADAPATQAQRERLTLQLLAQVVASDPTRFGNAGQLACHAVLGLAFAAIVPMAAPCVVEPDLRALHASVAIASARRVLWSYQRQRPTPEGEARLLRRYQLRHIRLTRVGPFDHAPVADQAAFDQAVCAILTGAHRAGRRAGPWGSHPEGAESRESGVAGD